MALKLFGRDVARRSHSIAGKRIRCWRIFSIQNGFLGIRNRFPFSLNAEPISRQTEIDQPARAGFVDHDVGRFDVAVKYICLVSMVQCVSDVC